MIVQYQQQNKTCMLHGMMTSVLDTQNATSEENAHDSEFRSFFHCDKLKEKISIDGDPTNLYSSEVSTSIAKLLTRLLKERESQILGRNTTQEPSQKPEGPSAPSVCCLAHNASTADNYCNASCALKRI